MGKAKGQMLGSILAGRQTTGINDEGRCVPTSEGKKVVGCWVFKFRSYPWYRPIRRHTRFPHRGYTYEA